MIALSPITKGKTEDQNANEIASLQYTKKKNKNNLNELVEFHFKYVLMICLTLFMKQDSR